MRKPTLLRKGEPPPERPHKRLSHGRALEPRLRTWAKARPIVRFLVVCTVHRCRLEGVAAKKLALEVLTEHRRALGATTSIAPTNDEVPARPWL